ncbi:NUDIX domain-containing protein [Kitasatospora sp. NPDC087314]|uniref:NUDIX domain-containing protein n=1 Tax=Kitasatospora sp. NPDC087314 TaxID=3364068 RepID=UPI0038061719
MSEKAKAVAAGHAEVRPGHVRAVWPMAAGALIRDRLGRVLLVKPTYHADRWLMAGGGMDRDGLSPRQTLAREVREELGLDLPVGRLLVVDWIPEEGRIFEETIYVFDCGVLDEDAQAAVRLPADELAGFGFFEVDEACNRLAGHDARRLREAYAVLERGTGPEYLESGRVPR